MRECVVIGSTMWRRAVTSSYRCLHYRRRVAPEGLWASAAVRTFCAPVLPEGKITALQAVDLWKRRFAEAGVTEPDHSSHYIIAHLLGAKTIESVERRKLTEFLSREKTQQIWTLCTRRLSRMPVQYIIEEWDFRDLTLKMRPPVFIPRPETEELVELVLADLKTESESESGDRADVQLTCLEVGCGSGAISLSLLSSLPQLKAVALDQSQDAVDLTQENALRLGVQDRLQTHRLDVVRDPDATFGLCGPVSVLVSNPPYLFSEDLSSLEPEILKFEDPAALDGGADGLDVVRRILTMAPKILSNHGRVYLEVDPRHPPLVSRWVEANVEELRYAETRRDVTGRPRFCILHKRGP